MDGFDSIIGNSNYLHFPFDYITTSSNHWHLGKPRSKHLLQHAKGLQRSRQPTSNNVRKDPILNIPGRAGPQQDINDASHGLVQRVLQGRRVAGPLVVQDCGEEEECAPL